MEIDREDSDFRQDDRWGGFVISNLWEIHYAGYSHWNCSWRDFRLIVFVRFAGLPSVAQYKPPRHCMPLLKRGRIKTSSQEWGFYIEILSREISHEYKRGVLNESRIMFDDEWCTCIWCIRCCTSSSACIKFANLFKIIIYCCCWCTGCCIPWTTTKSCSSNGIITHNASADIELIYSLRFDCGTIPTKYWSISNQWCSNIFYSIFYINISASSRAWVFECNQYFWFLWSGWPNISIDIYVSFHNVYLIWYIDCYIVNN